MTVFLVLWFYLATVTAFYGIKKDASEGVYPQDLSASECFMIPFVLFAGGWIVLLVVIIAWELDSWRV